MSAVVPGLPLFLSSRSARSMSSIAWRPASDRTPPAASAWPGARSDLGRERRTAPPRDVSIPHRREHREKRLDHRIVPRKPVMTRPFERGTAVPNVSSNPVAYSDAIVSRCAGQAHHLDQSHRRLVKHVLRLRAPNPPGLAKADRRIRLAGIVNRGRLEHLSTVPHTPEGLVESVWNSRPGCRSRAAETPRGQLAQTAARSRGWCSTGPSARGLHRQSHRHADACVRQRPPSARQSPERWQESLRIANRQSGDPARRSRLRSTDLQQARQAAPPVRR